ncbi:sugar ABC transporter substrate-binding protein [Streptomyces sp. A7024]|uniref:Sugar ABC transporter substrate-binding protein n=1 Tax=Streptomyces coryli TaxID=1128680 RepID=A0A6G4U336_9ACTN|nr:sugar ABC transporter substrate-binding protein [Streptomyces coryli]
MARVRAWVGGALALALGAAVAGCSSTGGKRAEEAAEQSGGKPAVDTPRWTVAMITHSGQGDTFWDVVRKGAQQAADKDNIKLTYGANPEANEQAQLVQNAIDQKVDGIVVTLAKPSAMKAVVQKAVKAGIPVLTINSGAEDSKKFGALAHLGQDEDVAGEAAGEQLNKTGRKKALCVLHEQGNVGHEQRCDGAAKTFDGTMEKLYVEGTNMPSVESSLEAKLTADKSIDSVLTLGAPFADTAVKAKDSAGSDAQISTFDLTAGVAKGLGDGTLSFAVDQQQYLQGYEAIDLLWLYKYNGNMLGGGRPVLTGPQILTKEDAADLQKYAERGTR